MGLSRAPQSRQPDGSSIAAHADAVVLGAQIARPRRFPAPCPQPFVGQLRGAHLIPRTRRFPRSDQIQTRPPAPSTRPARPRVTTRRSRESWARWAGPSGGRARRRGPAPKAAAPLPGAWTPPLPLVLGSWYFFVRRQHASRYWFKCEKWTQLLT